MIRDDATQTQVDAAEPALNTWLTANAGSGKTRVLTDRVARLLLNGVEPQNILCLTYTKAAASEMQNRLFKRLGLWAMLDDKALAEDLQNLGEVQQHSPKVTRNARRLFARAIETPGGLKIQTIHSFCANILRQFPLEAGISPQFTELDEIGSRQLRDEVLDEIAESDDAYILRALATKHSVSDFRELVEAATNNRKKFLAPLDENKLQALLKIAPEASLNSLVLKVFSPQSIETLKALLSALSDGSKTDLKAQGKIAEIDLSDPKLADLATLEGVFLTGSSAAEPFTAKIGKFPTKAVQKDNPDLVLKLNELMLFVEEMREQKLGLLLAERTRNFHAFATLFTNKYEARKISRGVLDFDDLIHKTRTLLEDSVVSQWVLFRLDGGIDHILVDEAQDTNPEQWAIVRALTDEFASGESSHSQMQKTVFVVGDKKQSIYSFQGADPIEFDRMQAHFEVSLNEGQRQLQSPALQHSFRSSTAILRVVDETFVRERAESIGKSTVHLPFHRDLPGRVDLWEAVEPVEPNDPKAKWFEPVDSVSNTHHNVQLANKIAAEIKRIIKEESLPVATDSIGKYERRKISEGDFLILVQRRSDLFSEIIRACKAAGLKVAGADRLELTSELAVKDIIATLSFLALPEDSLALASALRSPLFSWSEQEIFSLAHYRKEDRLWHTLRNHSKHPDTLEILHDLRSKSDFLRPFELIERLLTRHGGRKNLVARLGDEATDGIDAILSQAIIYEQSNVPSLTGFLSWLDTNSAEIKRQIDNQSDQIRIMTVHGAKGLEAPIVVLPDTAIRQNPIRDTIVDVEGVSIWKPNSDNAPKSMSGALSGIKKKQSDERLRLLYVAMTRAENWLIVAAAGKVGTGDDSWHSIVSSGLQHAGASHEVSGENQITRYQHGAWGKGDLREPDVQVEVKQDPIEFKEIKIGPARVTLTPSDLGGSKAIQGAENEVDSKSSLGKGRLIHSLLEQLPNFPVDQHAEIGKLVAANHPDAEFGDENLIKSVAALVSDNRLSWIFGSDSLSEVEVAAEIEVLGGAKVTGVIDRLIVSDEVVTIVDFKTNTIVPNGASETPEGILRQMAVYSTALQMIYPNHEINVAILWTQTAQLMYLPSALVSDALTRVNSS